MGVRERFSILGSMLLVACSFDTSNTADHTDAGQVPDAMDPGDGGMSPDAMAPVVGECPDDDSLVMCLRFEGTSGDTVLDDDSGYFNHVAVTNATFPVGVSGLCLQSFGGLDAMAAESPSLDIPAAITMEMWIRPDDKIKGGDRYTLIENEDQYALRLKNNDKVECEIGATLESDSDVLQRRRWQHVACTFDGTTASIFVDGVLVASAMDGFSLATDGTGGTYIAERAGGGDEFEGRIDTLRIWSRALSNQELCNAADVSCP